MKSRVGRSAPKRMPRSARKPSASCVSSFPFSSATNVASRAVFPSNPITTERLSKSAFIPGLAGDFVETKELIPNDVVRYKFHHSVLDPKKILGLVDQCGVTEKTILANPKLADQGIGVQHVAGGRHCENRANGAIVRLLLQPQAIHRVLFAQDAIQPAQRDGEQESLSEPCCEVRYHACRSELRGVEDESKVLVVWQLERPDVLHVLTQAPKEELTGRDERQPTVQPEPVLSACDHLQPFAHELRQERTVLGLILIVRVFATCLLDLALRPGVSGDTLREHEKDVVQEFRDNWRFEIEEVLRFGVETLTLGLRLLIVNRSIACLLGAFGVFGAHGDIHPGCMIPLVQRGSAANLPLLNIDVNER